MPRHKASRSIPSARANLNEQRCAPELLACSRASGRGGVGPRSGVCGNAIKTRRRGRGMGNPTNPHTQMGHMYTGAWGGVVAGVDFYMPCLLVADLVNKRRRRRLFLNPRWEVRGSALQTGRQYPGQVTWSPEQTGTDLGEATDQSMRTRSGRELTIP